MQGGGGGVGWLTGRSWGSGEWLVAIGKRNEKRVQECKVKGTKYKVKERHGGWLWRGTEAGTVRYTEMLWR